MKPLDVAITAARKAGQIILNSVGKLQSSQIRSKDKFDFVTNIDHESERAIIEIIRQHFPDHSFLAEETGQSTQQNAYRWFIDPLDGTTNFIHGVPFSAVSIALEYDNDFLLSVIYDPFRNELFRAERNKGAYLNENKIKVSDESDLARCLVATGFPFKAKHLIDSYCEAFSSIFQQVSDMRRAGSAALDLAYVAAGRFDGFWEIKLSPWDIAAGELLIREAGGKITDMNGDTNFLFTGNVVATNGLIHESILSVVRQTFANKF